ncbi:ornithine cyclodeaminase family protein [Gemmatimonas sp.]|jgi:ornithine cyclodeaminase/alanine dehydrogenase-like protein (mu-crystallin family)|uniref:ornithine cyclodeaminase family protein n=1 Tax=Gemmatimonas sp. TaxID=1962908 RepID=UPI0037C0EBB0
MLPYHSAEQVHAALPWSTLVSALRDAFAAGATVPRRHAHALSDRDSLLLMPAWSDDALGVKVVTFMPDARAARTVQALYIMLDRHTGEPLAVLDGEALTVRRTAATSVLAASYLARDDASDLLVIGTGTLAPYMVRAYCAMRPAITRVRIWGRTPSRAAALANTLASEGLPVEACPGNLDALQLALAASHIVCAATTSRTPIVEGAWLSSGTHVDLVGGFTPAMREADDDTMCASRIVVDSYDAALSEAGDLIDPLARGVFPRGQVVAELRELVAGTIPGRTDRAQITLFKSVGLALEDLAAATLVCAP